MLIIESGVFVMLQKVCADTIYITSAKHSEMQVLRSVERSRKRGVLMRLVSCHQ